MSRNFTPKTCDFRIFNSFGLHSRFPLEIIFRLENGFVANMNQICWAFFPIFFIFSFVHFFFVHFFCISRFLFISFIFFRLFSAFFRLFSAFLIFSTSHILHLPHFIFTQSHHFVIEIRNGAKAPRVCIKDFSHLFIKTYYFFLSARMELDKHFPAIF